MTGELPFGARFGAARLRERVPEQSTPGQHAQQTMCIFLAGSGNRRHPWT
jgi:hypothetical protein